MPVRERQETDVFTGNRIHTATGVVTPAAYVSNDSWCKDYTGPGDNDGFRVERITRKGGLLNGVTIGSGGFVWVDYPADYFRTDPWAYGHLGVPNRPSDGALAQQTIARTNPSRSSMQALEALAEIREFGALAHSQYLKKTQKLFEFISKRAFSKLSDYAKMILMVRFGLIPLLSDIDTLLNFQTLVDQRVKEIERLRTRGLRRTIDLWTGSVTSSDTNRTVQSNGAVIRATINKSTSINIRGHIRWYANSNWLKLDKSVQSVARRAISGYTLDPLTLYEIMPWSWLIDYFTNLGDFVKGSRNMFDAHHDKVRLSIETNTHVSASQTSLSTLLFLSDYEGTNESKERRITTPSISARIDFLTGDQWSILGALAALKSGL